VIYIIVFEQTTRFSFFSFFFFWMEQEKVPKKVRPKKTAVPKRKVAGADGSSASGITALVEEIYQPK
jgi:hypothetical protein